MCLWLAYLCIQTWTDFAVEGACCFRQAMVVFACISVADLYMFFEQCWSVLVQHHMEKVAAVLACRSQAAGEILALWGFFLPLDMWESKQQWP